jgi:hypothetical protein
MTLDPRVLILAPGDNIGVATRGLAGGTALSLSEGTLVLRDGIDVGHKFALRAIAAGEKIIKYRAPIGHATRAIAAGEYVHTHNMASDYLPTYTLDSSPKMP